MSFFVRFSPFLSGFFFLIVVVENRWRLWPNSSSVKNDDGQFLCEIFSFVPALKIRRQKFADVLKGSLDGRKNFIWFIRGFVSTALTVS